jgi:hypothetical protein
MKKIILLLLSAQSFWFTATSQGVGIGTTTPSSSAILELKSSTKGFIFPRTSTTSRNAMTGVKGLAVFDTTLYQLFINVGGSWKDLTTGPHNWSVFGNHIYNNNSGNVGIGTSVPTAKLEVAGDFNVTQGDATIFSDIPVLKIFGTASATIARLRFSLPGDDPDFAITQALGNLYISRYTGAFGFVSDLLINSTGLVGVGAADPQVKLHVDGGTDVGNASGGFLQLGASNNLNIGFDNNEIQGRNNGAVSRLVLNNGGGPVQIGSAVAPAGYSLAVNGRAICEELKIQASSNWPDYVFQKNYSLPSFDNLRNFISEHHHLPNIPDAATIEKNGIEVGDMQKHMMEKIEELTLYILQLEEKTNVLSRELESIKTERQ